MICSSHNRPSGHFSPHIDGPWVPHEDESSIFTVVIYLNSEFEGGSTKFLNEENPGKTIVYVIFNGGLKNMCCFC